MRRSVKLRLGTISDLKKVSLFCSQACVLVAALALLPVSGCKKADDTADATEVSVKVEKPEQGEISEHIMSDATLSPLAQAAISPKITAPVRKFTFSVAPM
jgi:hypothetical protein